MTAKKKHVSPRVRVRKPPKRAALLVPSAAQIAKDAHKILATAKPINLEAAAVPRPTVRQLNPLSAPRARAFQLVRDEDETGISGTGVVAEGAEFSNGMCALCWLTAMHSVAVYPNIRQLVAIHGHNGRARIVYL